MLVRLIGMPTLGNLPPVKRPTIVSFDCAGTLLETDYSPEGFAMQAARHAGLTPNPELETAYRALYAKNWGRYVTLNMAGDADQLREFWEELTGEWTSGTDMEGHEARIQAAAEDLLYHPDHRYFDIFPDTVPCLEALQKAGQRMIILSNWDVTLPRVLTGAGLEKYFERVFASLSFGIEKPDRRFFQFAESELGLPPAAFLHIGDREDDDLLGAQEAGWGALLLDRSLSSSSGDRLATLTDLPDLLGL